MRDEHGHEQMKMLWGRSECPAGAHERAFLHGGLRTCGGAELEIEEGSKNAGEHTPCVGRNKVWGSGETGGVETTGPAQKDKDVCCGVGTGERWIHAGQWMGRWGRPLGWFGHVGHLVCKPAEDILEDTELGRVTDGFVSLDETHSDLLYGIA